MLSAIMLGPKVMAQGQTSISSYLRAGWQIITINEIGIVPVVYLRRDDKIVRCYVRPDGTKCEYFGD